ncbi:hypothetical protein N7462_003334 [Penicillium macrosclerotiorum]|uniref:uncharacterized protein n=1 Tax=Penicillium macrosclerotiorum TaxID=303699 RepID=UPI002546B31D|nr:uncharacterized protein N7462_003334 [Penicillium macrosclerotiorum]KAJ5688942.1 hypothetical protein N7462_003334 [Penicillium macrosclerotiorum]
MSSYYEPQGWQAPAARQASWEQPVPPSRSGSSSVSQREDSPAFSSQFDGTQSRSLSFLLPSFPPDVSGGPTVFNASVQIEVDRAIDNLVKSGKLWNAPRRDSMPMMMGRPYPEYDPRMGGSGGPQRHHSISEFEGSRAHPSGNVQGFYASQRYQGRPNEVEQMMQAKRRMAAQRERELRNYHQEQQYNRSLLAEMSASKSDRTVLFTATRVPPSSPPGPLSDDNSRSESQATGTPSSAGVRGASPRGVDPFGLTQASGASADGVQSPTRANSTSSPSSAINAGFSEQPVTSTSSPGADSPSSRQAPSKPGAGPIGSVGPIGSRPLPGQATAVAAAANPALNKPRATTPLPSPLGFGFTSGEAATGAGNERSTSAASNPAVAASANGPGPKDGGVGLGWSNGSGVWGSKSGLGVQASVWG